MKLEHETWIQIPCAPKYEINQRGDVRNIKTGRLIKPRILKNRVKTKRFELYIGEDCIRKNFTQANLLWLTHGIIPKRLPVIPVIVSRGNQRYYFDNCTQAAQFLSRRECYSVSAAVYHLCKRREEIYGWKINYQR